MKTSSVLRRIWKGGGFTLVEVLAAVLILSIGLMAVLAAIAAGREANHRALCISIGRSIAQSRIEQARAATRGSMLALNETSQNSSLPPGNTINVAVSRYPDDTETRMFRVVVTVTWPEGRGTRRICYETLVLKA